APAARLDPGCGCANGAGGASRCASPGKAASTSSRVIPQRAARHTGGGVGAVVGGGGWVTGAALGAVCAGAVDGASCSFFPQAASATSAHAPTSATTRDPRSVMSSPRKAARLQVRAGGTVLQGRDSAGPARPRLE